MNSFTFNKMNLIRFLIAASSAFCLSFVFAVAQISAQTKGKKTTAKQTTVKKMTAVPAAELPKVTQVDEVALLKLLKRNGENAKPLLVNFWATWCGPCVEEFPDLVKISDDYQGKIDVITVTLDDLAEINTSVPQFLAKMKATMPTYLLKTTDENAAIESISKDWQGGLPFTILYDGKGATVYSKQAKFVPAQLRAEIDNALVRANNPEVGAAFEKGKADALKDISEGSLGYKLHDYDFISEEPVKYFQTNYGITVQVINGGWRRDGIKKFVAIQKYPSYYARGYNSVSAPEIEKKHGAEILGKLKRFPVSYPADVIELILTKNQKN